MRDKVILKISHLEGRGPFWEKGKLRPRYVGLFAIIERVREVAYKLELPEGLQGVHPTIPRIEFEEVYGRSRYGCAVTRHLCR